ncbi:MAG: DUF1287 domain-containing protein, partial [Azoarcus sp.]|nr:DUF1287 domain-containing protein [Azoarcus sp.]
MRKEYPELRAFAFLLVLLALSFIQASALAFSPERFVSDARSQIGKTLYYDPSYVRIPYPMGDVPLIKGVCTDVIIRALRQQGIDLQQRIHEDMRQNFHLYPNLPRWELQEPDANIDHRRVLNLQRYFERSGYAVMDEKFLPGDIVTWNLHSTADHIGIVSNKKTFF